MKKSFITLRPGVWNVHAPTEGSDLASLIKVFGVCLVIVCIAEDPLGLNSYF